MKKYFPDNEALLESLIQSYLSYAKGLCKGKGNGDIHPKYIYYVVRFLEHIGMSVRDSEMAYLGYEVVPFSRFVTTKLYRDRYAVKGAKWEYRNDVRFFESKTELQNYMGGQVALFRGDLIIKENETVNHKALAEVFGSVIVRQGATFTAPKLEQVSGSVDVEQGATFTAPKLASSGCVDVRQGATFTTPKLEQVSGYVDVRQGAKFTTPKLEQVSGSVYVQEDATFTTPKLEQVSGSVVVREGATFTAPKLAISGSVIVREGATFTAPLLKR